MVEGWFPDSSRVWPYEASKRGLPGPWQWKKLGWARSYFAIDIRSMFD